MKTKNRQSAASPTRELGRIVREQRKALSLTQTELALHAGVGLAFLYELEHGKPTVRLDKVLAVLKALGLSVSLGLSRPDVPAGSVRAELPRPGAR
jgi:y4mF family transcriptional regulator